jgi:hypothetical protein
MNYKSSKTLIILSILCLFNLFSEVGKSQEVLAQKPLVNEASSLKPQLNIYHAVTLAQNELEKRGLSEEHFVSSISLQKSSENDTNAYWLVGFTPPIKSTKYVDKDADSGEPKENSKPITVEKFIRINMDKSVTEVEKPVNIPRRRIMVPRKDQ